MSNQQTPRTQDIKVGDWVKWENGGECGMDEVEIIDTPTGKFFTGFEWIPLAAVKEVRRG